MQQITQKKQTVKKKHLSQHQHPLHPNPRKFIHNQPSKSHEKQQQQQKYPHKQERFYTDHREQQSNKSSIDTSKKIYYSKTKFHNKQLTYKNLFEWSKANDKYINSTKNSSNKNAQLKSLFNQTKYNNQIKLNNKSNILTHHSLLKNSNDKNKQPHQSTSAQLQTLSPHMKYSMPKNKNISNHQFKYLKVNPHLQINNHHLKTHIKQNVLKQSIQQQALQTIKKCYHSTPNKRTTKFKQTEPSRNHSQSIDYLTEQQEKSFGNRFPDGFEKIKLLGRGGFSLVWLGTHKKSGKQLAIKQILTKNTHQTHLKQIWFGTNFFTLGGIPKQQYIKHIGINNLVKMYSYEINENDAWIFYQKCGSSLGSCLYNIKCQQNSGQQKIYKIAYSPLYQAMFSDPHLLQQLIIEICKPLSILSHCQIVHSDLKTQNILIKYQLLKQPNSFSLTQVKLIDYGSSFEFKNITQFSMATPEYMPPEILNYIIHENDGQYEKQLYHQVINNYKHPWAVDMFSLGCVLLEIIVGVPLWMSLPLLVPNKSGRPYCQKQGLFAVRGRKFPQIIKKQRNIIQKLDQVLASQSYSKGPLPPVIKNVIKGMLCIDFNKRISPSKAIQLLQMQVNS